MPRVEQRELFGPHTELPPITERLGPPDFVGKWEGDPPGEFQVYILHRRLYLVPSFEAATLNPDVVWAMEGLIVDDVGISVFGGYIDEREREGLYGNYGSKGSLRFEKTYAITAVEINHACPRIVYRARLGVDGVFRGTYKVPGTKILGGFEMTRYQAPESVSKELQQQ